MKRMLATIVSQQRPLLNRDDGVLLLILYPPFVPDVFGLSSPAQELDGMT